jgi:hypothetical protein
MRLNHLLFFIGFILVTSATWAQPVFNYREQWELLSVQSFTHVHANFDSSGQGFDRLPPEHLYQLIQVQPQLRYDFGFFALRSSFLYGYALSENLTDRRTNGSLDHYSLGVDKVFVYPSWILVPRILYAQPQFRNDFNQDFVSVGEGVSFLEVGLDLRTKIWKIPLLLDVAYVHRDFLSQLVRFRSLVQIPLGNHRFYGGIQGYSTVMGESLQKFQGLDRVTWFCRVNGCASVSQASNPRELSLVGGYVYGNWAFQISHGFNGLNTSQNTQISVSMHFGSGQRGSLSPRSQGLGFNAQPLFIEETETPVEESLFKKIPVLDPFEGQKNWESQDQRGNQDQNQNQNQNQQRKQKPSQRTSEREKQKANEKSARDIEKQLEMQIELRQKSKINKK